MEKNFFKVREHLSNEYVNANYDKESGIEPADIERKIVGFIEENEDMPLPLVVAKTLAIVLESVQIEINPYSIFPEKMNSGAGYEPWQGLGVYGRIAHNRCRTFMQKEAPDVWDRRTTSALMGFSCPGTDFWHAVPDWEAVVDLGVFGLFDRAREALEKEKAKQTPDPEKLVFYESVVIAYTAFIGYMCRVAKMARERGMEEYAQTLTALTKRAPDSFYEALITSLFFLNVGELGVEHYRTYGQVDKIFYPFYEKDVREGVITRDDAAEMIRYFLERTCAARREAQQPICLGGLNSDGTDRTNELSYLFLEVYGELGNLDPKIHIRVNENSPRDFILRALDYIRSGISSIVLLNDECAMRGYERLGIPREVSYDYLPIGCYEPVIPGVEDARICGSWMNLVAPVGWAVHGELTEKMAMLGLPEPKAAPATFEEFKESYYELLGAAIDFTLKNIVEQVEVEYKVNPSPILSGSYRSCMESGRDMYNRGAEMRNLSVKCFAIGSAVDSLLAVKKVVYDEKLLTLAELSEILKNNWKDQEKLRLYIRADKNKWGNDYEEPNALGREIYDFCAKKIVGVPNGIGGVFRLGADSVAMSEHYGYHTPATPDGRYFRSPTTKNFRAQNGMEREGVTAFINSVTTIDCSYFINGSPIDLIIHPSAVEGEGGLAAMEALMAVYFSRGGFAFQGNVLNADTLIEAQNDPDRYRNLQVRVCGWNEYFVNMSKFLQNDLIARVQGIERA